MQAANHLAYKEELERCRFILEYVRKALDSTLTKKEKLNSKVEYDKRHYNSDNSQNYIDLMINDMLLSSMSLKIRNLITAKDKPYFARVDFQEEKREEVESLYIGKMSLVSEEDQETIIIDWRAPIANLYYEERLGKAHFNCPDGYINGLMLLKRQYSINNGILEQVSDVDITTNDEFLQSYLGANSENRLKEIVSTIQVEQNRIIRTDMWKPIVVQGVAGSGKTTIALHRIAYLIYMHEKTLKPENFMIIAPTKFFLNYISEVLPELGVERVAQSTFETFAVQILDKKFKVEDTNNKLLTLISNTKTNNNLHDDILYKATKLKTSMKFKQIIDKYVNYIEKNFIPAQNFEIEGQIIFTRDEIKRLFLVEYKRLPLVKRIDEIKKHMNSRLKIMKDKIVDNLYRKSMNRVEQIKKFYAESDERQQLIIDVIDLRCKKIDTIESLSKKLVNEYVKSISKFSPWQYYYDLMTNQPLLSKLAQDIEDIEAVKFMGIYTSEILRKGFIETEDYAPLIYLKYMIYGINEKIKVRQVIIDEAQDFSVFQLFALKKIIDCSFSILGDLSQGIHSYRGIDDWDDVLKNVFEKNNAEYMTLEQSYRTTIEIMDAANIVIGMLDNDKLIKAKPVFRHGEAVRFIKECDKLEKTIIEIVNNNLTVGNKSVAVIAKTLDDCKKVYSKLKRYLPDVILITGKEEQYTGGIVVVPSYLSKGLEFDAVIIIDSEGYINSELDIKLLYVAMTRALHRLYLIYKDESVLLGKLRKTYIEVKK